jgi:hypothetical protein
LLVIADLMGSHRSDVPTISPSYWLDPPQSAVVLKADPELVRIFGVAKATSAAPGYASVPINFFAVRDTLDWSLPPVWGIATARGETPIISRRLAKYSDPKLSVVGRLDLTSVTHLVSGLPMSSKLGEPVRAESALIYRNRSALPRVRLMGRPYYVKDEQAAIDALSALGEALRDRLLVEDPDRPLKEGATVSGTARIIRESPEYLEIETDSSTDAYLYVADTYDPGWSATLDRKPVSIRPAYVAFRAVFIPKGRHTIIFRYTPAGFETGLWMTGIGILLALVCLTVPIRAPKLDPEHGTSRWRTSWPRWELALIIALILLSVFKLTPEGRPALQTRWAESFHPFTWGAKLESIPLNPADN